MNDAAKNDEAETVLPETIEGLKEMGAFGLQVSVSYLCTHVYTYVSTYIHTYIQPLNECMYAVCVYVCVRVCSPDFVVRIISSQVGCMWSLVVGELM